MAVRISLSTHASVVPVGDTSKRFENDLLCRPPVFGLTCRVRKASLDALRSFYSLGVCAAPTIAAYASLPGLLFRFTKVFVRIVQTPYNIPSRFYLWLHSVWQRRVTVC